MKFLLYVPIVLCFMLMGAHFLRTGVLVVTAVCLVLPMVMLLRRSWVPSLMQIILVLFSILWFEFTREMVMARISLDLPCLRLAVIMGIVITWNLGSALLFLTPPLKKRWEAGSLNHSVKDSSAGA